MTRSRPPPWPTGRAPTASEPPRSCRPRPRCSSRGSTRRSSSPPWAAGRPGQRVGTARASGCAVVYDGPDLETVATHWGCSVDEVVSRHTEIEFVSTFTGFAPGFAYLAGLPADWAVPRLATPRAAGGTRLGRPGRCLVRGLPDGLARRLAAAGHDRRSSSGTSTATPRHSWRRARACASRRREHRGARPGSADHAPGPRSSRTRPPGRPARRCARPGSSGPRAPTGRRRPRRRGARDDDGRRQRADVHGRHLRGDGGSLRGPGRLPGGRVTRGR